MTLTVLTKQGWDLKLYTVYHKKHFLVLVVPETVTAESGIRDTMIN